MSGARKVPTLGELVERIRSYIHTGAPAVEAVVGIGLALETMKSLHPRDYEATVRSQTDLDLSDARKHRAVAAHPVLSNCCNFQQFPARLSTLYELSLVPEAVLVEAIASGRVTPRTVAREAAALRTGVRPAPITKPDLGGGVSHPARFSDETLAVLADLLAGHRTVLDPFAGAGRIHELRPAFETTGIEIEPEWAAMSPHTTVGDALGLPFGDATFDAIATSPTHGNRLADHHEAADADRRRSYAFDLGRPLHPHNSGAMQWGVPYRELHQTAWGEAARVLAPGGVLAVALKDHTRDGRRQAVSAWHVRTLIYQLGFHLVDVVAVQPHHLRQGANADARWAETVWLLGKPAAGRRRRQVAS